MTIVFLLSAQTTRTCYDHCCCQYNYEEHAPRVSQVIAAVAKVSCKHGLWLVARVNRKKPFRFSTRGFQYFYHKENHLTRCGANVRFPVLYCQFLVART